MALNNELDIKLKEKIGEGEGLMTKLNSLKSITGILKLEKKIKQEINFLLKVLENRIAKKEHLVCTNLHHFKALIGCILSCKDCVSVLQYFMLMHGDGTAKRVCVDIVAQEGEQWIKVIARNPRTLSQLSSGNGEFGQRSVIDQAFEYVACASQHPHLFKIPQVTFHFACGIEELLANQLQSSGVVVSGERVPNSSELNSDDFDKEDSDNGIDVSSSLQRGSSPEPHNDRLNLDVTAMIAYVTALTNGSSHFIFKEPILSQQARWERDRPVKPVLDQLFQGKRLHCCKTAATDFQSIVATLGGPSEVKRASELMGCVTVVPDQSSPRVKLRIGGKVKRRSLVVFSTGDALRAVTVTANHGFIRAARNQGVEFAVCIHESRALTESKEKDATLLVL